MHAHVLSYATPRGLEEIGQEDVTDVSNASNHLPWFITRDYYAQVCVRGLDQLVRGLDQLVRGLD